MNHSKTWNRLYLAINSSLVDPADYTNRDLAFLLAAFPLDITPVTINVYSAVSVGIAILQMPDVMEKDNEAKARDPADRILDS